MTSAVYQASQNYHPAGATANDISTVFLFAAGTRVRHVRVCGAVTYLPYPTNVVGDDGIYFGVVGVFPGAAPGVPSLANEAQWRAGFWGRPDTSATEALTYLAATIPGERRTYFTVEFDCSLGDGGGAGALYCGYQALYVDANHALPTVSASVTVWGFTP